MWQWSRRRQVSRTPRGVRRQPVVRAPAAAVSIGASAAALASGSPRLFRSSSLSGRVPKRASSSAASLTVRSAPGCPAVSHAMEDLLNTINSFTKDDSKWCSDWDRACDLRCVSCRECIPPRRTAGAPPLQIQGLNIRPSTQSAPLAKKHASDEFISLCAKYIPGRKRRLISLADYEFAAIFGESGALCIFTSDCVRVFLFWGSRSAVVFARAVRMNSMNFVAQTGECISVVAFTAHPPQLVALEFFISAFLAVVVAKPPSGTSLRCAVITRKDTARENTNRRVLSHQYSCS